MARSGWLLSSTSVPLSKSKLGYCAELRIAPGVVLQKYRKPFRAVCFQINLSDAVMFIRGWTFLPFTEGHLRNASVLTLRCRSQIRDATQLWSPDGVALLYASSFSKSMYPEIEQLIKFSDPLICDDIEGHSPSVKDRRDIWC